MLRRMEERTLVVDFDGTITEQDLLDEIARTFGDEAVYREVDEGLDRGRLSLHEVIRREFEPVRAELGEVIDYALRHTRVRPGFRELVDRWRAEGGRVVIVSSGMREFIEPVLEREGLADVELVSNAVEADPSGWRVVFRDEADCAVCGEACKRATVDALSNGGEVVYVGDGYSDRCAAERSDRVFARRGLARWLEQRGIPYEPFEDFHDVARALENGA